MYSVGSVLIVKGQGKSNVIFAKLYVNVYTFYLNFQNIDFICLRNKNFKVNAVHLIKFERRIPLM